MANAAMPKHGEAGPSARKNIAPEEDARKLQFGAFAEAEALTLSDVQMLLTAARTQGGAPPVPDNKVYKSAVEYVNEFSNASGEVNESMRTALAVHSQDFLNPFEVAQIMYLRPESVEVAFSLIPSLHHRLQHSPEGTAKLEQILEDVRSIARYGARP